MFEILNNNNFQSNLEGFHKPNDTIPRQWLFIDIDWCKDFLVMISLSGKIKIYGACLSDSFSEYCNLIMDLRYPERMGS